MSKKRLLAFLYILTAFMNTNACLIQQPLMNSFIAWHNNQKSHSKFEKTADGSISKVLLIQEMYDFKKNVLARSYKNPVLIKVSTINHEELTKNIQILAAENPTPATFSAITIDQNAISTTTSMQEILADIIQKNNYTNIPLPSLLVFRSGKLKATCNLTTKNYNLNYLKHILIEHSFYENQASQAIETSKNNINSLDTKLTSSSS